MVLTLRDNAIYTEAGQILKRISCPLRLVRGDLEEREDRHFDCSHCDRKILNTDFMSESAVVSQLTEKPDTCVYINLGNPIFELDL